jgi:hypothetical protein
MIPEHCRHVSVHKVNYKLTVENIKKKLMDSNIYKGTEYLILNNNDAWCIVRIGKTPRKSLFWQVTGVDIISSPENTIFVSDSSVDVLNINAMSELSQKHAGKTVVVRGRFEHVSFVTPEDPIELVVFDVFPPEPVKLTTMAKEVLKYISLTKPIKIIEKTVDITTMIENCDTGTIVLPCQASDIKTDKKIIYLDGRPNIESETKSEITLIGCDLSLKIFRELYRFTPEFINICPIKLADEISKTESVVIKCCNAKSFERSGNLYTVPWGVTYKDLEEAFRELILNNLT